MKNSFRLVALSALALVGRTAAAQLPEASAVSFGMGGNYMAAATGFEAVAFNPAMLGVHAPKFSLSILSLAANTGLDPVKFNDITEFGGKVIPASTKEAWLNSIGAGGRERGAVDAGLSLIALNIGHLGFQVGVIGGGELNINQDAAEALLYGNAGRTGTAKSFNFSGSNGNGSAFGTGAVSLGIPISSSGEGTDHEESFAIGITGKYIVGLGAGRAQDNGSTVTPDNIKASFPAVFVNGDDAGNAGSGMGVDVGFAVVRGRTTFSAAARNVLNTFEWDVTKFRATPGTASFDGTNTKTDFTSQPYSSAPQALRTALEEQKFKPTIAAGIAHEMHSLLLTVDASDRIGDGIEIGPKMHVGVGAEFTGIPLLALRGGVAAITGGFQAAGGVGIHLGPIEVSAGLSTRSGDNGTETGAMLTLISIR
jgi:hypothetical protein